ncbi:hypothetical protein WT56_16205 [Burkholderia pseudomultivorans]|uniref:Uncharacterized protein n=1 Tax=Burkholderia pseudomultivorans TaxID=1207504 RepID=A0A132EIF9_9BURK|nr:hypothetical protein WT56_16205 [Burkholderia pseudomultivorans]
MEFVIVHLSGEDGTITLIFAVSAPVNVIEGVPACAAVNVTFDPPATLILVAPPVVDVTYAVVAICVVFVPFAAVGAVGVPVNAGDASGAYVDEADAVVR